MHWDTLRKITEPDEAIQAHMNLLAGNDNPGRRFLIGLYSDRIKRGDETIPDEVMGWHREFEAHKPAQPSRDQVLSL